MGEIMEGNSSLIGVIIVSILSVLGGSYMLFHTIRNPISKKENSHDKQLLNYIRSWGLILLGLVCLITLYFKLR